MYTAKGRLAKDKDVKPYLPLVRRIAHLLMARLPSSVEVDDLVQNGLIGLLDAMERFEDGMGAQFETYAVQRVRGAMLDGLRENDWLPRSVRKEMRRVEEAIRVLEHQQGRAPSESELAKALDMPLADYQKLLFEARGHQLVYVDEISDGNGEDYLDRHAENSGPDPLRLLEEAGMREALTGAIDALPEREKLMMSLYYEQDLNLREIGEVMGVTESRVCQLHSQAVARLRAAVGETSRPARTRRTARDAVRA